MRRTFLRANFSPPSLHLFLFPSKTTTSYHFSNKLDMVQICCDVILKEINTQAYAFYAQNRAGLRGDNLFVVVLFFML